MQLQPSATQWSGVGVCRPSPLLLPSSARLSGSPRHHPVPPCASCTTTTTTSFPHPPLDVSEDTASAPPLSLRPPPHQHLQQQLQASRHRPDQHRDLLSASLPGWGDRVEQARPLTATLAGGSVSASASFTATAPSPFRALAPPSWPWLGPLLVSPEDEEPGPSRARRALVSSSESPPLSFLPFFLPSFSRASGGERFPARGTSSRAAPGGYITSSSPPSPFSDLSSLP